MAKIRILDDGTINRIAAGEVVERPRSVVKELVENAIDAGARRIDVEIEGGGRALVRVVDDGEGMDEDDMLLALERHATSKIRDADELAALSSLGFRGEALPSIASVSHIEILTRPAHRDGAMRVEARGGAIRDVCATAGRPGTSVTVRKLFFNTPARQKHLRSETIEAGHVRDFLVACALARPDLAFRLRSGGRVVVDTPGTGDLMDALAAVFGARASREFLPVARREHPELPYVLSGFVGGPQMSRASSKHLFWCVNGRTFQSPYLTRAVVDAFAGRLPERRWPVGALVVEADPRVVDVNVHPAKTEVRFSFHQRLRPFVVETVRDAVARAAAPFSYGGGRTEIDGPPVARSPRGAGAPVEGGVETAAARSPEASEAPEGPSATPSLSSSGVPSDGATRRGAGADRTPAAPGRALDGRRRAPRREEVQLTLSTVYAPLPLESLVATAPGEAVEVTAAFARPGEGPLEYLGQVFGTYLVLRSRERFMLVDQHAAHERIRYERIGRALREGGGPVQGLLIPLEIALEEADRERIRERAVLLERYGFSLDFEDEGVLRVRAYPAVLEAGQIEGIVRDVADGLAEGTDGDAVEAELERLARLMACHGAVRAGDGMDEAEVLRLLEDLAACAYPMTCPHGRPTAVAFSEHEVRRLFARE